MKWLTVFCGSSAGNDDIYHQQAVLVGKTLAEQNIGIVYGGAKVGLMGAVANGALQAGGKVIGVLPRFLQAKEVAHNHLTELVLTDTMHERKTKMNDLSDGVIALPGGYGTMDELFEMLTWGQLGLHKKPIGLLNTAGFYNNLLALADDMVQKGFLKPENRRMLLDAPTIEGLLGLMRNYIAPEVGKWITKEGV